MRYRTSGDWRDARLAQVSIRAVFFSPSDPYKRRHVQYSLCVGKGVFPSDGIVCRARTKRAEATSRRQLTLSSGSGPFLSPPLFSPCDSKPSAPWRHRCAAAPSSVRRTSRPAGESKREESFGDKEGHCPRARGEPAAAM